MTSFPLQGSDPLLHNACRRIHLGHSGGLDEALLSGYLAYRDHPQTRRTHYFGGRFENVFIPETLLPALSRLLEVVLPVVRGVTGIDGPMRHGVWFNAMTPGQRTTLHSHDGYDEWLSAVYYIRVPHRSGDLVLHTPEGQAVMTPRAGELVLFDPVFPHEVEEHRGRGIRLSAAMNFGPARD